jgi:hypothetical protein
MVFQVKGTPLPPRWTKTLNRSSPRDLIKLTHRIALTGCFSRGLRFHEVLRHIAKLIVADCDQLRDGNLFQFGQVLLQ